MNSKQKKVILFGIILLALAAVYWQYSGGEIFSKDGVFIEKELTDLDKMLGQAPEKVYQEKFILGLLPHTAVFAGVVVAVSGILFFIFRNKKTKEE
jgi:hypothetical protein